MLDVSKTRKDGASSSAGCVEYAGASWERGRRGVPGGASPPGCFPPAVSADRREKGRLTRGVDVTGYVSKSQL
jgi:hypothetical protein